MKIVENIDGLIGNTPLFALNKYVSAHNLNTRILAKLEYLNASGSIKDRVALAMINAAESLGALDKDTVIIEPTSGNTGIGLAAIAAARGYRLILTMPKNMSAERRRLLKAYGATIDLTPATGGMQAAIARAKALAAKFPKSFIPSQFENPINPLTHEQSTGVELWQDSDGKIDYFICGVGTGGTITGVGRYLKSKNSSIKIVAVEPAESAVLSGNPSGPHQIQGIGAGFVPAILDEQVIDEIIAVSGDDAFDAARQLAKTEGLLCGISSGAAIFAATQIAHRANMHDKVLACVLPDSADRYLSTKLFE